MNSTSRSAKFAVIGGTAVLVVVTLGWLVARSHRVDTEPGWATSSSDGWTCEWLDAPTVRPDAPSHECSGVVQCRHRMMLTFVPQIRQVTCAMTNGSCDAADCFTRSIRAH